MKGRILLLHPVPALPRSIGSLLGRHGYEVEAVAGAEALLRRLDAARWSLVLVDLGLPGPGGLELLVQIHDRFPALPVVMLAPPGERAPAARALQLGAADFILLPPDPDELVARVDRLLDRQELEHRIRFFADRADRQPPQRPLVCRSPAMQAAVRTLERIAPTRSTVLLLGESGVGKELFARAIHFNSPRLAGPWIPLNCSALPESIIESELFGHEKGAFTGAVSRTRGKFEIAHRGTIFLDEIGEMTPRTQSKLLRVLEEREVTRVGGASPIRVDVRLIAATNDDLEARLRQGSFRKDLYFRLKVVTIEVPPLRRRREDIPDLARLFLAESVRANQSAPRSFSPEAIDLITAHDWPGNVREMKNLIESLVVTTSGPRIEAGDLPDAIGSVSGTVGDPGVLHPGLSIAEAEEQLIRTTLRHVGGHRGQAARLLHIGVRTLQRKIRRYGLEEARRGN